MKVFLPFIFFNNVLQVFPPVAYPLRSCPKAPFGCPLSAPCRCVGGSKSTLCWRSILKFTRVSSTNRTLESVLVVVVVHLLVHELTVREVSVFRGTAYFQVTQQWRRCCFQKIALWNLFLNLCIFRHAKCHCINKRNQSLPFSVEIVE